MKRESVIEVDYITRVIVTEEINSNGSGQEWRGATVYVAVRGDPSERRPTRNDYENLYRIDDPERAAIAFESAAKMIRQFMKGDKP